MKIRMTPIALSTAAIIVFSAAIGFCAGEKPADIPVAPTVDEAKDMIKKPIKMANKKEQLWQTNMDKAMLMAAKENKDILIDFTGSDWCGWCKKLDAEVFSTDMFKTEAPKQFVLVKLDFPQNIPQTNEEKEHNKAWAEKLAVRGYPTIVLTDSKGNQIARTGYRPGGEKAYMDHLKELKVFALERTSLLEKAKTMEGIEKAKALDSALMTLNDDEVMTMYGETVDEIIALDADNAGGLKNKYQMKKAMKEIEGLMKPDTLEQARKKVDETITTLKPTGQELQDLDFIKGQICMYSQDKTGAKTAFEAALAAEPKGQRAEILQNILTMYFSPIAEKLVEVNTMVEESKDYDKGVAELDKAEKEMKLDDEQKQQLYALKGDILMRKGDNEGAKAALTKALELAPESRAAARIKGTLETQLK